MHFDWTFRAKLTPPKKMQGLVERPKLLKKMIEAAENSSVLFLDAPAGYGKTSLLIQFHEYFEQRREKIVWLTLDQDDKSPVLFVQHLWAAFAEIGIVDYSQEEDLKRSPRSLLEDLINHTAMQPLRVTLVFDDQHCAHSSDIERLVDFLIERRPPNLLLIFSGRGRASGRFATLELNGTLRRFTLDDLCFDVQEIVDYFDGKITLKQAFDLLNRTQGWPVALQLVRLWFASGERKLEDLTSISGRSLELAAYLIEAVFLDLSDDVRSFLLETSVLTRLHGDLINSMLARSDSWLMIEAVLSMNLFVVAADEHGQWFKYHPLFSEFLLERLRREKPGREVELRQAAAVWLMKQGLFIDGAIQAKASGDRHFTAGLLEEHDCTRMVMSVGTDCLDDFGTMELAELVRFPNVAVSMVYKFAQDGQLSKAAQLHSCLSWILDIPKGNRSSTRLKAQYAIYGGIVAVYKDRPVDQALINHVECTLDNVDLEIEKLEAAILLTLCDLHRDDLGAASNRTEALALDLQQIDLPYFQQFGYLLCGLVAADMGRLTAACQYYLECLSVAEAHFQTHSLPANIANLLLAEAYFEQGDVENAEEALPAGDFRLGSYLSGWFEVFHSALLFVLPRLTDRYGLDHSLEALATVERHARHNGLERLLALVPLIKLREALHANDMTRARIYYRELDSSGWSIELDALQPSASRHVFLSCLTKFRFDLAEGELHGWSDRLTGFADYCCQAGWNRWHVRFLIASSLCKNGERDKGAARQLMAEALSIAEPLDLVAPFYELPDEISVLIASCLRNDGLSGQVKSFASEILAFLRSGKPNGIIHNDKAGTGHSKPGAKLSPREEAVLSLMAEGMTSKDIARSLNMSIGVQSGPPIGAQKGPR